MKVGVNLINFGPSANADTLRRWAGLVEALGYHSLMTSDHIAVTPDVGRRYPAPLFEPVSTLGWLAGITKRIAIGTTVIILPYRSPLETARAFANIDQLSGGRCILGVGVGWAREEFAALGVPASAEGEGHVTLDADRGRGAITTNPLDEHSFKTPTLRNIDRTAPYFHNGAFADLQAVVDFYDEGGGKARGIALPNQDPDVRKLDLGKERKRLLLTFMRGALRDD